MRHLLHWLNLPHLQREGDPQSVDDSIRTCPGSGAPRREERRVSLGDLGAQTHTETMGPRSLLAEAVVAVFSSGGSRDQSEPRYLI